MNMTAFIESALKQAVTDMAQEILIHPQQPLQLRVGRELIPISGAGARKLSSSETRQMVSQILNEDEKKGLFENLKVEGSRTLGPASFKFSFQVDFDGIAGSLEIQNPALSLPQSPWPFPQLILESLSRPQGLHLVIGPRRSGKSAAIQTMLQSLRGRQKVIAIYSDREGLGSSSDENIVSQFSFEQLKANGVLPSCDLVVIDSNKPAYCEVALRLAEEGRSVLLSLAFWDLQMGIQRFLDLCESPGSSSARRLSMVLQTALGLRLMPGTDAPLVGAYELLTGGPEVQVAISQKDFGSLENMMKTTGEKTGMRGMNQALFHLLIKRKIEMKTAFEYSPEPQELDALLKKVGI